MKIIFLDVDGVLNHAACPDWMDTLWVLDDACVQRVVDICNQTGAQIVLSSTWRLASGPNDPPLPLLRRKLGRALIGSTPVITHENFRAAPRHEEIEAWLMKHPDVVQFVVIDDDADAEVPGQPFVRTSFENGGLTPELAEQVRTFLL